MKKPIFTNAYWILLLLGVLVCGFFVLMAWLPLLDSTASITKLQAQHDDFEKWSGLLTWATLISGGVWLLVANLAYLRENRKGLQFLTTGIFWGLFFYLDWTMLGNKGLRFALQNKLDGANMGDVFSTAWGYIFAGIALALCIANWVWLARRRKAKGEVPQDEPATPPSSES